MERPSLAARTEKPKRDAGAHVLDGQAAMAMAIARRLRPPMKVFVNEVRIELGWSSLSRRAVYKWECGEVRVPAVALMAAAKVSETSVDELLNKVHHLERLGLRPGE